MDAVVAFRITDMIRFPVPAAGVPHPEKGISIISIAMCASNSTISAMSGKLGMLPGVSTKTIYAKTEN